MDQGWCEQKFDTPVFAKVTAEAKERLDVIKASLARKGFKVSEQSIITALILAADEQMLETKHRQKQRKR